MGKYVQVRVNNDDGSAALVVVDTVSRFYQGPIRRLGTVGTARSVYVDDQFSGSQVSYTVSSSAVITYDGEVISLSELESGWYATILVSNNMITRIEAYPGSVTVEGTVSGITYGTTTVLEVTLQDDSVVRYELDIADLPTIYRDNKSSSIEQLRTGDTVTVTVRYNEVERIDAASQSADLSGTITRITMEASGVTMEVQLTDGTTATYTVSDGVSVSQGDSASNIYNLKPGYTVDLVTSGGGGYLHHHHLHRLLGHPALRHGVYRLLCGQYPDHDRPCHRLFRQSTPVVVNVRNASLLDVGGNSLSLTSGFSSGDLVQVYGEYDGATFVARIVIKLN